MVCLGTAVVDTIFAVERLPLAPGKNYARSVLRIGGGVAANAAVTVSALGGAGVLWGGSAPIPWATRSSAELAEWRVDVRGVRQIPGSGLAGLDRAADLCGDRQIVNYLDGRLFSDAAGVPLAVLGARMRCSATCAGCPRSRRRSAAAGPGACPASSTSSWSEPGVDELHRGREPCRVRAEALAQLAGTEDLAASLEAARPRTAPGSR